MSKIIDLKELSKKIHQSITTSDPNVEEISKLMELYECVNNEWEKYVFINGFSIDAQTPLYTRHLVDKGNGYFNLMLLVWKKGAASTIHSHSSSNCIMKTLKGTIIETRYDWPTSTEEPMNITMETAIEAGQHGYICDDIGLHRVENKDHTDFAVSLHLYWPPYKSCYKFDEFSGRRESVGMSFTTVYDEEAIRCQNICK